MTEPKPPFEHPEKTYWLDDTRNVTKIIRVLAALCIGLFLADFFYHKHTHFEFENWIGFYGWYGFLAYCCIVLSAKGLRKLLKRPENYYD
jgi:hypothetical protein